MQETRPRTNREAVENVIELLKANGELKGHEDVAELLLTPGKFQVVMAVVMSVIKVRPSLLRVILDVLGGKIERTEP